MPAHSRLSSLAATAVAVPAIVLMAAATHAADGPTAQAADPLNALPNGDFAAPTAGGRVPDWVPHYKIYDVLEEDGNPFVRFVQRRDGELPYATRRVPIDPALCRSVTFSARVRVGAVKPGKEAWHAPRFALVTEDGAGKRTGDHVVELNESTGGQWVTRSVTAPVPPGTAKVIVQMGIIGSGKGTTADFDDLVVLPHYFGDPAPADGPAATGVPELMAAKRYDEAAAAAERQTLAAAAANRLDAVEQLQKLRARALRLGGRPQDALAAAKRYYNVCRMGRTADAVTEVGACLRAAHPGDAGRAQRFRAEQTAAAAAPAPQPDAPAGTVLGAVPLDPEPYASAAAAVTGGGFDERMARGTLLLLAGRADEAGAAFRAAYAAAPEARVVEAVDGIARCMRAADGSVTKANAWVLSLQQ